MTVLVAKHKAGLISEKSYYMTPFHTIEGYLLITFFIGLSVQAVHLTFLKLFNELNETLYKDRHYNVHKER